MSLTGRNILDRSRDAILDLPKGLRSIILDIQLHHTEVRLSIALCAHADRSSVERALFGAVALGVCDKIGRSCSDPTDASRWRSATQKAGTRSQMSKKPVNNRSATRALEIFELFSKEKRCLFLTEVADALDIPLSSCFHLMKTLEVNGYAYSLGARRGFYPTTKMRRLVQIIAESDPLERSVGPILQMLGDETRETLMLTRMVDDKLVTIAARESPYRIRFIPEIGEALPLHSTSGGRAVLGALPLAERKAIVAKLPMTRMTDKTLTDKKQLLQLIEMEVETGFHTSLGDTIEDLGGISKAVNLNGQLFSLTVGGPLQRVTENLRRYETSLSKACSALEEITW